MTEIKTTIELKRVEFPDTGDIVNFCFEIKAGPALAFAISVPIVNDELHRMWLKAYGALGAILDSATKEAVKNAKRHAPSAAQVMKGERSAEEKLLKSIFKSDE